MSDQLEGDEGVEEILRHIKRFARPLLKTLIVTIVMATAIAVASGSVWKTIGLSFIVFSMASFGTWRRYFEPIAFLVFLGLLAYSCVDFSALPKLALAAG